ncbi:glycoside hydrolase family 3 protein [Loktanella sp. IMCC34160]|nr:glycoside hydrolase family 3 N-terminal domain-containing protein [Loktanella sp. IMCC34160]RYG92317.1 glycoside hydrolase family 3 protein [Loktanella sp. IMCC34160]
MRTAAIFGPEGLSVTDWERGFFRASNPVGFILFARNVDTPDQLRRLTADLRDSVGWDAPVLIDQEGGRVQRMRAPHWREYLPPLDQAQSATDPEAAFIIRYKMIAAELRAVGIDVNCVPTLDIAGPETHPFLRNRCLGTTPEEVARNGRAVAKGCLAGGVLPVMKHMPGHGRATLDSHKELPTADVPLSEATAWDFAPFRALADLPIGMTAHMVFPEAGPRPATQNPAMIDMIRTDIGFGGLLLSDDLSMEALSGGIADRAAASVAAGCDVVLHCNGKGPEMEAVAAAAGSLTDPARARVETALSLRKPAPDVDIAALSAELEALLG